MIYSELSFIFTAVYLVLKNWKFRLELFAYCWSLCHTIFDVLNNVDLDTQHKLRWGSELQTLYCLSSYCPAFHCTLFVRLLS